jgi:hypothetical protein
MKLRNKKTGEIGHLRSTNWNEIALIIMDKNGVQLGKYNSLAELNSEWEDYEEKKIYYIDFKGEVQEATFENVWHKQLEAIGNYFNTREEAEKAVEKLKAWKRLKDKGFRFETFGFDRQAVTMGRVNLMIKATFNEEYHNDAVKLSELNLLFGGEE